MNLPEPGDYIDIHNHGTIPETGNFQVESLMVHEEKLPENQKGSAYTIGIHPWFLTADNFEQQIEIVKQYADNKHIIAIGETGFDRLKGPPTIIQQKAFEEQVKIAEMVSKPLVIHCVRAWDELLFEYKRLKPSTPWLIHGFRGKKELAMQLISKGMYLSFWFEFILQPESSKLIRSLPKERIFLETDGSGIDIRSVYNKVASDLGLPLDQLKNIILSNYNMMFKR
jgi:TatD DNase family protein